MYDRHLIYSVMNNPTSSYPIIVKKAVTEIGKDYGTIEVIYKWINNYI